MGIRIEPATEDDLQFVEHSWLRSYRNSNSAGMIAIEDWQDVMVPQIRKVLSREGVEVFIARDPDGTKGMTDILGFVAVEHGYDVPLRKRERGRRFEVIVRAHDPLVHYIFVKHNFRRYGIATALLRRAGVEPTGHWLFTCKTLVVAALRSRIPNAEWKPAIARHPKRRTKPDENRQIEFKPSPGPTRQEPDSAPNG